MRIRDLFAGRHVDIAPDDEKWTVTLVRPGGIPEVSTEYAELPAALDAARDFLLMLTDETEIVPDAFQGEDARNEVRAFLARQAAGEPWQAAIEVERLREWFLRQMNQREWTHLTVIDGGK